jgi:hypothetical protein
MKTPCSWPDCITIQGKNSRITFPWLEEELEPLTENQKGIVHFVWDFFSAILTSASTHNSWVAIPLATVTAGPQFL